MIVYHQQFAKTTDLLTSVNVGSIKMFKLLLISSVDICDLYLFHFISLLNADCKLVNNLISSSLDKVTTLLLVYIIYNILWLGLHLLESYLLLED